MTRSPTPELFLGRQPILDRKQNLAAFELLFRSGHFNGATIEDDVSASATVINHAFTELDVKAVLGKHPGFTLALDDFVGHEREFTPLLDVVDIVKVDVQRLAPEALERVTRRLGKRRLKLLAEKLASREQADHCLDLGYELFQGYYFARPSVITGRRLSRSETALMRLLHLLLADGKNGVDAVLAEHPELTDGLSRLARLVTAEDSASTPTARRPQRWLPLLIYMVSSAPGAEVPSPLLVLAATRGKLMELLARALRPSDREFQERAFLTGTLSLVNALLAAPLSEILGPLPVAADVRAALLAREGELGALLALVETLEESDLASIERALERVPGLDHGRVIGLQVEAMRWADFIGEPD